MARLPNSPYGLGSPSTQADPFLQLNRLLGRLEQSILHATVEQEQRLRKDEFERAKVRYDIEAARTSLARIADGSVTKLYRRKPDMEAEINRKRLLIDDLLEQVQNLEDAGRREEEEDSSDGEDVLAGVIQTPSESMDSRSTGVAAEEEEQHGQSLADLGEEGQPPPPPPPAQQEPPYAEAPADPPQSTQQEPPETRTAATLRARTRQADAPAAESGGGQSSARAALFGERPTAAAATATATEEALLDGHRREQEALTEDMARLAGALKARSLETARLLAEDGEVVGRVAGSLDTTDRGMESAGRRMGSLTRITEGKGWWGRMLLYAMVYGMMALVVLIWALLPKLRF
jgi:hypothetical protein